MHVCVYTYIYILECQLVVHLFPVCRLAGCPRAGQLVVHVLVRTIKIGVFGNHLSGPLKCGFGGNYGSGVAGLIAF